MNTVQSIRASWRCGPARRHPVLARGPDQYPNGSRLSCPARCRYPATSSSTTSAITRVTIATTMATRFRRLNVGATFEALTLHPRRNQKVFGGGWAVHAIVPLVSQRMPPFPGIGNGSVFGLGDIVIDPLIIGWHFPPDWHLTVGVDIYLPAKQVQQK
ncbi:MAG: transporter [Candidatus Accumulibacter sp.]|nr:transporter [Candidatus Accumulibacter propinquus]